MTVPISPGRGLGFFTLGTSIFDILTEIRASPKIYPSIGVIYDPAAPLSSNVVVVLEMNGLRLRFDGADQRLRMIEVTNFQRCKLSYNGSELVRSGGGPTFRSIYNKLFGPAYPGEYISDKQLYVLSYPGVAFSFPIEKEKWSDDVDFVSLLSSASAHPASSVAIFQGASWSEARNQLFTQAPLNPRSPAVNHVSARQSPANDEIELAKVLSGARVELLRRHNPPFLITLHSTTPQDLIVELGPPSSIYYKNDHRLSIHKRNNLRNGRHVQDDTDETEGEDKDSDTDDEDGDDQSSSDYFYNYYNHGFDVFISTGGVAHVATKVILHGNVPGSLEFQRYRRCRWVLSLEDTRTEDKDMLNSEMSFDTIYEKLKDKFGVGQKPMLLNRGSDSPSSSVELLGGWEESDQQLNGGASVETTFGNTELYGFPGLIFEVLKNKAISALTIF